MTAGKGVSSHSTVRSRYQQPQAKSFEPSAHPFALGWGLSLLFYTDHSEIFCGCYPVMVSKFQGKPRTSGTPHC